jgi:hypothetical protein
MSLFDKLNFTKKKKPTVGTETKKPTGKKTAKEVATENDEPWVNVLSMDIDPANISNGAFELDWNDKFVTSLVRAGYQKQPNEEDYIIVDRWLQVICRNVVQENYEQEQADPELRRRGV